MTTIYQTIVEAKAKKRKLLAVLLDPDKIKWDTFSVLIERINESPATHVFVGGSIVVNNQIDEIVQTLKLKCKLPIVLFPGSTTQISQFADGILFITLISGRNSDYLIDQHVKAAPILKKTKLEVISTGYILVASGQPTAVEKVSKTIPIKRDAIALAVATAQAGEMLGNKLIYLEAGSGANQMVPIEMIASVSKNTTLPLLVGGGIVSKSEIEIAYESGADFVIIGTAFERDFNFFNS